MEEVWEGTADLAGYRVEGDTPDGHSHRNHERCDPTRVLEERSGLRSHSHSLLWKTLLTKAERPAQVGSGESFVLTSRKLTRYS